ncbi:MAG TPA: outer membrane protein [Pseudolabrys sp.]|jgi:outer membrane immunogenic protein
MMKRVVLAGISALAVVTMMGAANAADIQRRQAMPTKAPAYVAAYNWTGMYVGVNGGGGFGHSTWSGATGTSGVNTTGGVVGGTVGYNYQMNQAVFGLEGDIDWSNIHGSTTTAPCTTMSCETRNSWLGTARGRIGYAFDRFMPFVTGGAAFGDIKNSPAGFAGDRDTKLGWTLGGGLEAAIAGPWTAKVEYLYVDLGKTNCPVGSCAVSTDVNFHTNLVRAGLNYRF